MSEIMLAKGYDPKKIKFPVEVTIKLDGVAADFYKTPNGWVVQSRQGKPIASVDHIVRFLDHQFSKLPVNTHIVGELTVMGVGNFKEAAGIIRRHVEDRRIVLNVYDMYVVGRDDHYSRRVMFMDKLCNPSVPNRFITDGTVTWDFIKRVPGAKVFYDMDTLQRHLDTVFEMMSASSLFEGFIIRALTGTDTYYRVGKRPWTFMKYKPKPTVDLQVVGFEEAIDKHGNPKGMVGRIECRYKDGFTGVGPGCLTHKERTSLWELYKDLGTDALCDLNIIAEVEYMLDPSYDKLRQPTFKRWRDDKTEESLD